MARKTKKSKQRAAARRGQPLRSGAGTVPASAAAGAEGYDVNGEAQVSPVAPERRRVERIAPGSASVRQSLRGQSDLPQYAALETEDPAIPLERVPYATADLRRVGLIALMMVVLIIIADIVVNHLVH